MIRAILNENISNLCERDVDILKYVTGKAPIWFELSTTTDNEIVDDLFHYFGRYKTMSENGCVHPFYETFKKITLGANVEKLIYHTDFYGENYKQLAENVNKLWGSEYRSTICTILKAFAERDFDELKPRFCVEVTLDYVKENITKFLDVIADNLDECDLRCILQFCGWHNIDE